MIRAAKVADIQSIQQVAVATWRHTYKGLLPPKLQQQFLAFDYNYRQLYKRITSTPFFVAELDGHIVGFAHFLNEQRPELEALYVLPTAQQQGIGRALIGAGITDLQLKSLHVRVLQSNTPAIRFYERQGFHYVSTEDFSVSEGTFSIQLMKKMIQ